MVETGNGALIFLLHEFHSEDGQTGMEVVPAHILNQFDFFWRLLVWMEIWASGTISEEIPGAVIEKYTGDLFYTFWQH